MPFLRDELIALKARRDPERDDFLFGTGTGTRDALSNVRRRILAPAVAAANEQLERAGEELIPGHMTLHGLGHTNTSIRFYLDERPDEISVALGHANPSFTYEHYWKEWSPLPGEGAASRAAVRQ